MNYFFVSAVLAVHDVTGLDPVDIGLNRLRTSNRPKLNSVIVSLLYNSGYRPKEISEMSGVGIQRIYNTLNDKTLNKIISECTPFFERYISVSRKIEAKNMIDITEKLDYKRIKKLSEDLELGTGKKITIEILTDKVQVSTKTSTKSFETYDKALVYVKRTIINSLRGGKYAQRYK